MCKRRFPGAPQSSGSYVQFVIQYQATTFQTLIVSLVLSRLDYGNAVLAGLPAYPFRRLQSVMNAAARLIYGLHHSDHISDALISLHWLRAQERVRFKTAVRMYKATHGTAPSYLSRLVRVADLPGRRSLRSARTNRLLVPPVKLSTVGGRAFPVAGPTIWNSLPDSVIGPISPVSVNLPSAFKNISVPGLIP